MTDALRIIPGVNTLVVSTHAHKGSRPPAISLACSVVFIVTLFPCPFLYLHAYHYSVALFLSSRCPFLSIFGSIAFTASCRSHHG
ncbi:hypothetical protein PAXINDRAFT_97584 [Paxillus involutus ATCC 200175]|nr:hypothetical protein PAXINDRAFT_97584 [Paxillus involutus ATCC 200175]